MRRNWMQIDMITGQCPWYLHIYKNQMYAFSNVYTLDLSKHFDNKRFSTFGKKSAFTTKTTI